MKPEIKARWVKALRSGEYAQGQGELRDLGDGFCCLGILCDLAAQDGVVTWELDGGWKIGTRSYWPGKTPKDSPLPEDKYLPGEVREWAGIDTHDPMAGGHRLSVLNDDEATFEEIADLIEAHL